MLNPFRNIALNLQAIGPTAALCIWFICIAAVAIFAPPESAKTGFSILSVDAAVLIFALSQRSESSGGKRPDNN